MPAQLIPEVYKRRRKQLQDDLVNQVSFLGYTVIVLHYLKYGSSTLTLILRLCTQSLLTSPYPSEFQLRRLTFSAQSRALPGLGRDNDASVPRTIPRSGTQIPGAFTTVDQSPVEQEVGTETEDISDRLRHNIRWILFHCSFTVNCILIILSIMWPIDFGAKAGEYKLREKGLSDVPSPFNNQNGLVGGELRGRLFIQFIGERVSSSNFRGNLGLLFLEVLVFICQFCLYLLTCYNLAKPPIDNFTPEDYVVRENDIEYGGYGGNVLATTVDPMKVFDHILRERYARPFSRPTGTEAV
ncbi:LAQU0S04e05292g1_1 [Lachancea quebecensis]|uniref:LAQU0S04e05292g1_1 n=1 Tax=Lachancea quebecensis TaxID=1654605 RepID=A0A0P1KPL5_9SACH|nr:LAQU0S04e05292g1_1 [Lachancea quebecensis]